MRSARTSPLLSVPVTFGPHQPEGHQGIVIAASRDRLSIQTSEPYPTGAFLHVRIAVPHQEVAGAAGRVILSRRPRLLTAEPGLVTIAVEQSDDGYEQFCIVAGHHAVPIA